MKAELKILNIGHYPDDIKVGAHLIIGGYDNASISFPELMPILSKIVEESFVIRDGKKKSSCFKEDEIAEILSLRLDCAERYFGYPGKEIPGDGKIYQMITGKKLDLKLEAAVKFEFQTYLTHIDDQLLVATKGLMSETLFMAPEAFVKIFSIILSSWKSCCSDKKTVFTEEEAVKEISIYTATSFPLKEGEEIPSPREVDKIILDRLGYKPMSDLEIMLSVPGMQ